MLKFANLALSDKKYLEDTELFLRSQITSNGSFISKGADHVTVAC